MHVRLAVSVTSGPVAALLHGSTTLSLTALLRHSLLIVSMN